MYEGERFNSITHLIGSVLAIGGLPLLIVVAARTGEATPVVSFAIYGTTLVLTYLLSTLYHAVRGRAKETLQKLDHVAIFLLIAGTYTPVALVTLGGALGWTLFGINWGLATVGIVLEFVPWRHARTVALVLYPVMGWLALPALGSLVAALGAGGTALALAGGVLYTGGLVAYAWEKIPHNHGIWHLFVLGGSLCHFLLVLIYVR